MTDVQLYLAVGMPTIAVLLGIVVNRIQLKTQFGSVHVRLARLDSRLAGIESRFESIENRLAAFDREFDAHFNRALSR